LERPNGSQVALLLFLFIAACSHTPRISFEHASFSLELAKTDAQKEQGLMYRESMPSDAGMLFFFDTTEPRTFWMKNTKIPLDMISLDENLTVTGIADNVPPCVSDPCAIYPLAPGRYVLEINGGAANSSEIRSGSKAVLRE